MKKSSSQTVAEPVDTRDAPKRALYQRAYHLIPYRDPEDGLPAGSRSRELGQVGRFEAQVWDGGGWETLWCAARVIVPWMGREAAVMLCVTANESEGGDVARARAWVPVFLLRHGLYDTHQGSEIHPRGSPASADMCQRRCPRVNPLGENNINTDKRMCLVYAQCLFSWLEQWNNPWSASTCYSSSSSSSSSSPGA
jgi:hypothetical protein